MIKIPELESFGFDFKNTYIAIYSMLGYEMERLSQSHLSRAVNDIYGYRILMLTRMTKSFHTLYSTLAECHDYVSSSTLIRMLADSLAAYLTIYHEQDDEEMKLRHFLYVIDGTKLRLDYLEKSMQILKGRASSMSDNEHISILSESENSVNKCRNLLKSCTDVIKFMPVYKLYKNEIDILIQNRNWQYQSLSRPKIKQHWADMYLRIDNREIVKGMFSFLSQYAHGLSVSNLILGSDMEAFYPLYSYGIVLMGKVQEIIENEFNMDRHELLDGFMQSDFFEGYFGSISDAKRQEMIDLLLK